VSMAKQNCENLLGLDKITRAFTIRHGMSSTSFTAVDHVALALRADEPEILAVAGESGSGKSTLALMILGLLEPTSGRILFKNRDVTHMSARTRRKWFMKMVQPVFQNPFSAFSPLKRVDSYLYETALNLGITDKKGADLCIGHALTTVGLSLREIRGRFPNELSGGQIQRVAIARALITDPALLVADEPVSMLDASLRLSIVNVFRELKEQQGVSVVYITHDLAMAYYASDRIAIMLRGGIVELGTVQQVLGDPLHPYTRLLKNSIPEPDPNKKWSEKVVLARGETEEFLQAGCKFASRCPQAMDICTQVVPQDTMLGDRLVKCPPRRP